MLQVRHNYSYYGAIISNSTMSYIVVMHAGLTMVKLLSIAKSRVLSRML